MEDIFRLDQIGRLKDKGYSYFSAEFIAYYTGN